MSIKIETTLERKARQAAEGKVAMQEYRDDHNAKLVRMAKLKKQRLARQTGKPAGQGK